MTEYGKGTEIATLGFTLNKFQVHSASSYLPIPLSNSGKFTFPECDRHFPDEGETMGEKPLEKGFEKVNIGK